MKCIQKQGQDVEWPKPFVLYSVAHKLPEMKMHSSVAHRCQASIMFTCSLMKPVLKLRTMSATKKVSASKSVASIQSTCRQNPLRRQIDKSQRCVFSVTIIAMCMPHWLDQGAPMPFKYMLWDCGLRGASPAVAGLGCGCLLNLCSSPSKRLL